jgi:hypothetical protein
VAGLATVQHQFGGYDLSGFQDGPDDPLGIESYRQMRYAMYLQSGGRIIL